MRATEPQVVLVEIIGERERPYFVKAVRGLRLALRKAEELYESGDVAGALKQYEIAEYTLGRWELPQSFEASGVRLEALRRNYETLKSLSSDSTESE